MKPTRHLAGRSRELRGFEPNGFLRETFHAAAARGPPAGAKIIDKHPPGGPTTVVENWRQLPDGQIEFTMRRLPTGDELSRSGPPGPLRRRPDC